MSNKLILVLNCGSSSLKFAIINPINNYQELSGIAECFYLAESKIKWEMKGSKHEVSLRKKFGHNEAIDFLTNTILSKQNTLVQAISAIGHRVVHGGEKFHKSTLINHEVIEEIEALIPFAPLHNPASIMGIQKIQKVFPHLKNKQVAVFDTAFHQTMPSESYLYPIPYYLYKKYGIRRYGAHGISHYYVTKEAAKKLNKSINELNVISCHLGNGSSITAILNGKSVDTSMGLTPLEGLVMGTRSGDIDPSIIFYLHNILGMSLKKIHLLLTKESGILGLTTVTNDYRYVENNYYKKLEAKRTMDVYCHRLAKYIASYSTLMQGRLDAIIFTGGIGENSSIVRALTLKKLSLIGIKYHHERNLSMRFGKLGTITAEDSIPAFVIPTNEELVIAQDTNYLTK
ncbi:acetate kinase [Arsenophonus symbiont of Ornithomya chloropus]|uniref:acetate kinase n=1 Tax=Arsenophonus symbiont of Ornithomya chloropus TaxID=634121 RepID=UPI0032B30B01